MSHVEVPGAPDGEQLPELRGGSPAEPDAVPAVRAKKRRARAPVVADEEVARVADGVQRWEYLLLEQPSIDPARGMKWMPEFYGQQGWELVAVVRATETIDRMWFKRQSSPHKSADTKEKT